MNGLLRGSIREAFSLTLVNWRSLLEVTLVPMLIMFVLSVVYFLLLIPLFKGLFSMIMSGALSDPNALNDPAVLHEFTQQSLKIQTFGILISLASLFFLSYACVRIVRLQILNEERLWNLSGDVLKAAGFWALYSIGIYLIAYVAMLISIIPLAVVIGVLAAILTSASSTAAGVIGGIVGVIAGVLWIFVLFAVGLRFASGMPVIALGQVPDFFSDMWKNSRGLTMALAGRGFALYILVTVVILLVFAVMFFGPVVEMISLASDKSGSELTSAIGDKVSELVPRLIITQVISFILYFPIIWLGVVWLTIVNRRIFEARKTNPA